jgi:hypothetical protein
MSKSNRAPRFGQMMATLMIGAAWEVEARRVPENATRFSPTFATPRGEYLNNVLARVERKCTKHEAHIIGMSYLPDDWYIVEAIIAWGRVLAARLNAPGRRKTPSRSFPVRRCRAAPYLTPRSRRDANRRTNHHDRAGPIPARQGRA